MTGSGSAAFPDENANFVECIRSGLAITGDAGAGVIEFHLKRRFGISLEEVPTSPSGLIDGLFSMFGEGARPVFLSIIRELLLCSHRGIEFTPLVSALTDALRAEVPPTASLGKQRVLPGQR